TLIVLLTDTVGALPPAPGPPPKSAMSTLIGKAPAWAYVLTPETSKPPWAFLVMVPLVRWPSPQLMVAVKSLALAAGSWSLKGATRPRKGVPAVVVAITAAFAVPPPPETMGKPLASGTGSA